MRFGPVLCALPWTLCTPNIYEPPQYSISPLGGLCQSGRLCIFRFPVKPYVSFGEIGVRIAGELCVHSQ